MEGNFANYSIIASRYFWNPFNPFEGGIAAPPRDYGRGQWSLLGFELEHFHTWSQSPFFGFPIPGRFFNSFTILIRLSRRTQLAETRTRHYIRVTDHRYRFFGAMLSVTIAARRGEFPAAGFPPRSPIEPTSFLLSPLRLLGELKKDYGHPQLHAHHRHSFLPSYLPDATAMVTFSSMQCGLVVEKKCYNHATQPFTLRHAISPPLLARIASCHGYGYGYR